MNKVTIRDLLKAGMHFGHRSCYWNPQMSPYIFNTLNKIHIIDLEQTLSALRVAQKSIQNITASGGKVLFVGTKNAARDVIKECAVKAGQPYVSHRWLGGTLTNYKTIRCLINSLEDLEVKEEDGTLDKLTTKEALMCKRKMDKLELKIGGIREMGGLPDALFVIDAKHENIAITEAKILGIPVIALVDTNSSPKDINIIIPGNDDATRSIKICVESIVEACIAGTALRSPTEEKAPAPSITIKSSKIDVSKTINTADTEETKAKAVNTTD